MPTQHRTPDPVRVARSRLDRASMRQAASPPEVIADARRDLAAAVIERTITERLAAAPPLTPEQRTHLAALIYGGGGRG